MSALFVLTSDGRKAAPKGVVALVGCGDPLEVVDKRKPLENGFRRVLGDTGDGRAVGYDEEGVQATLWASDQG